MGLDEARQRRDSARNAEQARHAEESRRIAAASQQLDSGLRQVAQEFARQMQGRPTVTIETWSQRSAAPRFYQINRLSRFVYKSSGSVTGWPVAVHGVYDESSHVSTHGLLVSAVGDCTFVDYGHYGADEDGWQHTVSATPATTADQLIHAVELCTRGRRGDSLLIKFEDSCLEVLDAPIALTGRMFPSIPSS